MLSVALTLALMAALVLCHLPTRTEHFATVSPTGFWRNTLFIHQLLHFVCSTGLQEKILLCFPWINSVCCLNCG